jgi:hypothetical protein
MSDAELKVWCAVAGVLVLACWLREVASDRNERRWDETRKRRDRK